MDKETIAREAGVRIAQMLFDKKTANELDKKITRFEELSSIVDETKLEFGKDTHIEYRNLKNYLASLDPQSLVVYKEFLIDRTTKEVQEEAKDKLKRLKTELSNYLVTGLSDRPHDAVLQELEYYFSKYQK